MSYPIETVGLSKQYGAVAAVDQLSLRVGEGEIYAFLGLNGAGKTTTIRMLLGMIKPSAGSMRVLGQEVRMGSREPWGSVGYLVETPHAYPELTVVENLEVARRLHPGTRRHAVVHIIEQMGLVPYANTRAGVLSLGNAQRLGLAKALLHEPQLLILDEPSNGLDPAGIVEIRRLLLTLAREHGTTIFMSSHILGEVSRLAQRIGVIHQGTLLQEMSVDELNQNRRKRLLVQTRDHCRTQTILENAGHKTRRLANDTLELTGAQAVMSPDIIAALLVNNGTPPTQLLVEEEELEHYFLRLVGMEPIAENGLAQSEREVRTTSAIIKDGEVAHAQRI